MATHYLYLTNSRLVSLMLARGQVRDAREFEITEEGAAAFDAYLATVARVPVHLITDLAEEDLRADTVPHVGAGDRQAIIDRKLAQIFRNTPYRHALLHGRETEGRRDDRIVYLAITNPDELKPWLDMLERREVPLAAIHSAAVLGTRVLEALALTPAHALLVHFSPGGALRQTYFRGGEIRFTRLTPMDHEDERPLGAIVADETTRTWQYLDNLRSFANTDRLEIYVLAHPKDRAAIEPTLSGFDQIAYHVVDTDEVAARIGLKPPPADSSAERILASLHQRRGLENHFASAEMRRYATFARTRNIINAASVAILGTGIIIAILNLHGIFNANDDDQKAARELQTLNREYDQVMRSLPTGGVGGAAMRDAVAFYRTFIQGFPSLSAFLVPLSGVLEAHPRVRLAQLSWQATDDPRATPLLVVRPPAVPPPVKSAGAAADVAVRPPTEDPGAKPFVAGRYEVALVEAAISVPSHDFRSALAEVERLAEDIRRVKGYEAQLVQSPLDVRPSLVLQGRHAEREAQSMEARFVLRILRKELGA